jgi:hypothetical protein
MKFVLSWSGERSKAIALALHQWIPQVIQHADPWMSHQNIPTGSLWLAELMAQLKDARMGIVCLTPENVDCPWLHFEAGAIIKAVEEPRVCPYLFGLELADVEGPIASLQMVKADEEGTRKVIHMINEADEAAKLSPPRVDDAFQAWWPRLAERLHTLPSLPANPPKKRDSHGVLEEVLEIVRRLERRSATEASIGLSPRGPLGPYQPFSGFSIRTPRYGSRPEE